MHTYTTGMTMDFWKNLGLTLLTFVWLHLFPVSTSSDAIGRILEWFIFTVLIYKVQSDAFAESPVYHSLNYFYNYSNKILIYFTIHHFIFVYVQKRHYDSVLFLFIIAYIQILLIHYYFVYFTSGLSIFFFSLAKRISPIHQ